jgi:4-hydroxy-tetrahydrodipicolinate reductase
VGVIAAPNFALGAVLMMSMAKLAAKYFDYVEITELHHEQKIDAPSGTAVTTAKMMVEARGKPFLHPVPKKEVVSNSRGGEIDGVAIHSVRMPGLFAHQEVLFGGLGQTLTIRHDTGGRECYIPGILLAIKKVVKTQGLIYGLDKLLSL